MKLASINEVESFLYALPAQTRDYESRLAHVKTILASLGSPQNRVPAIHIAGTSGKGSTAYYATSLLVNNSHTVGLIVSPHVHSIKERAQINGKPLSDKDYLHYFNQFVDLIIQTELTYIEFLVVFAFWLFAQLKVDYIVVEVGIGGRLDATNVLSRAQTVRGITDIGFDHTEILGNTLPEITAEKAGIIHEGDTVIINDQPKEVLSTIIQKASSIKANLEVLAGLSTLQLETLPLYQRRNWQLAHSLVSARLELDNKPLLSEEAITTSLAISIPGRFEQKTIDGVTIILDAAHNPQKIKALASSLNHYQPNMKPVIVAAFGANKVHSVAVSVSMLESSAAHLILTKFHLDFSNGHDSLDSNLVAGFTKHPKSHTSQPDLLKALTLAITYAKQHKTYVVITGSFYLLDNVYPLLTNLSAYGANN